MCDISNICCIKERRVVIGLCNIQVDNSIHEDTERQWNVDNRTLETQGNMFASLLFLVETPLTIVIACNCVA